MTDNDQFHSDRIFQRLNTTAKRPYPRHEYIKRAYWEMIRRTLFRFAPAKLKLRPKLLRHCGAKIGRGSKVLRTAIVRHPWLFTMGEYSVIADGVNVYNLGPITIGDHTVISQFAHLCAGTHDYTKTNLPLLRSSITIGSGVWICADAFIGPDVTIGDNVIVAARAVVTRDVPANVIVAGNPAKIIKERHMPNIGEPPTQEEFTAESAESAEKSA
jgi:putative colanic acid biosynthesis acetyltransferase WcaF